MWSLGAVLYLLITGQTLFHNDQEDNLNNQDLIRLSKWCDSALKVALAKVHDPRINKDQPLGRDLLEKLLQPDASQRPKTMADVLKHPFFVGESPEELAKEIENLQTQLEGARAEAAHGGSDQAVIIAMFAQQLDDLKRGQSNIHSTITRVETEQKKQTQLLEAIAKRTINIEAISDQTYIQLRKTERVLLRSMFEATEVTLPTSFVIMPSEIEKEGPSPTGSLIQLAEDGSGVELGAVGEELKEKIEKQKGWFDKVCKLGASIGTGWVISKTNKHVYPTKSNITPSWFLSLLQLQKGPPRGQG
jgi:serine/threonine protein kinase